MRLIDALLFTVLVTPLANCSADEATLPKEETVDEQRALKDAAEMIGTRPGAAPSEAEGAPIETAPSPAR